MFDSVIPLITSVVLFQCKVKQAREGRSGDITVFRFECTEKGGQQATIIHTKTLYIILYI